MTGADLQVLFKKHPLSIVCVIVALACGVFLYLRGGKNEEGHATLDAKNKEAEKIQANVRNSAKLPEQVQAMQQSVKEAESRLIRPAQLATNLQIFYRLESETGVKLLDIRQNGVPARASAGKNYVGVPFTASVQGSFKQVMDFLQRVGKGGNFARFTNVNFAKAGSAGAGADTMTVTCSLELLGNPAP